MKNSVITSTRENIHPALNYRENGNVISETFNHIHPYIMSQNNSKSKTNIWLVIGVIVLIVLLFGWLTLADMSGDTDVSSSTNFATDVPTAPANQPSN